ncbi:probable rRNA-processing protein EBP2 [Trichonephila inaurata madagascariensis]|uniref:Probable rRNA-processing protein EBP2 n=1 Tax=Trichonephila inaurata madagascariensis TaxID=2747483 RepID=A0A8X7BRH6_9ARAC|nr:probable rRNA-processing protein EBP2 [Trichonephila inaurata madagascariensis]
MVFKIEKMSDLSDASVDDDGIKDLTDIAAIRRKIIPVNNVAELEKKLKDIQLNFGWIEKLDITVKTNPLEEKSNEDAIDTNAEHDFKREMLFYNQALAGANKAIKKLKKMDIPTKRPDDFLAEMAKSDAQMLKVREKLLSKQKAVERIEKVRAIREQKKHGKIIQKEIIENRKKEKKQMIDALKKTTKGKMDARKLLNANKHGKENFKRKSNKSREFRNAKYGYGGKKKGSKYNTSESCAGGHFRNQGGKKPPFGKTRKTNKRRR